MAQISIDEVNNKKYYKIEFGDTSEGQGIDYALFWADDFWFITKDTNQGFITLHLKENRTSWKFSFDGANGTLMIDDVDGVTPQDNDELAELLASLKK